MKKSNFARATFSCLILSFAHFFTLIENSSAELPALPLIDCVANGLPINDEAICEGGNVGYIQGWPVSLQYHSGDVPMNISTRTVDFRRPEDNGGQTVTFTLATPIGLEGDALSRHYKTAIQVGWPEYLEDDIFMDRLQDGFNDWTGDTGGAAFHTNTSNPPHSMFQRQGTCAGTNSCSYTVTWDAYPHYAVFQPLIYRMCLDWNHNYIWKIAPGDYGDSVGGQNTCGNNLPNGCLAGGGRSCVTFRTDPPPPLKAVAKISRIGSNQFSFDGTESGPDVVSYKWTLTNPTVQNTQAVFEYDFTPLNLAKNFQNVIALAVVDKWRRTVSTFESFGFAFGVEGDLEIVSITFTGLQNGSATYKVIVKNKSSKPVNHVFLATNRFPAGGLASTDPTVLDIPAQQSAEFALSIPIDTNIDIFIDIQALGQSESGPVKSASKTEIYGDNGPGNGDGSGSPNSELISRVNKALALLKTVKGKVSKKQKEKQAEISADLKELLTEITAFIAENQASITGTSDKINFAKLGTAAKKLIAKALKRKGTFADDKKAANKALAALKKGVATSH